MLCRKIDGYQCSKRNLLFLFGKWRQQIWYLAIEVQQCYIPEYSNLYDDCHETLKCHKITEI